MIDKIYELFRFYIQFIQSTRFQQKVLLVLFFISVFIIYTLISKYINAKTVNQLIIEYRPTLTVLYLPFYQSQEMQITHKVSKDMNSLFNISVQFQIFYDFNLKSSKTERGIIGIIVNNGQIRKIDCFINYYPQYKIKLLPNTKCLSFGFNLSNFMPQEALRQLINKRQKEIKDKNIVSNGNVMLVYNFLQRQDKFVKIFLDVNEKYD